MAQLHTCCNSPELKVITGVWPSYNPHIPIEITHAPIGLIVVSGDRLHIEGCYTGQHICGKVTGLTMMFREFFVFEVSLSFWPTTDNTVFIAVPILNAVKPKDMKIFQLFCDDLLAPDYGSSSAMQFKPQFATAFDTYRLYVINLIIRYTILKGRFKFHGDIFRQSDILLDADIWWDN